MFLFIELLIFSSSIHKVSNLTSTKFGIRPNLIIEEIGVAKLSDGRIISDFLGYNYSNEIFNNIYNKCTFEYMKLNSLKCTPIEFKNSNTFINKGTNKRWKDILNENDINNYNELMSLFFDSDTVYWVENGNS